MSSKWSPSHRFPHQNPLFANPLSHTCYLPRPSHSSLFDHQNHIDYICYIYIYVLYIYLKNYLTIQAARNNGCGPLPENNNKIFVKYLITGHPYCLCEFYFGTYTEAVPLQAWSGPEGSRKLRFPDYVTTAQDGGKVVSPTHRPPLPPRNAPGTHFC